MEADEETDVENLLLPPDDVRRRMIRLGLCGEEKYSTIMNSYYVYTMYIYMCMYIESIASGTCS